MLWNNNAYVCRNLKVQRCVKPYNKQNRRKFKLGKTKEEMQCIEICIVLQE